MITTITNEQEYQAALAELNQLWDVIEGGDVPHPSLPRFNQLVDMVEAFEGRDWPVS